VVQNELRNGNFITANDHGRLSAEIKENGPRETIIDVLVPEMVRICRPQLQLDALFRMAVKLRDDCRRYPGSRSESRRDVSSRLAMRSLELPTGDDDDFATTRERLQALDVVHPILERWSLSRYGSEYLGFYDQIALFKQKETAFIADHGRDSLTAEEADALQSISF
jgi:hypothetical protein